VRPAGGTLILQVRLTPNAAKDAVDGWRRTAGGETRLAARVRAVPEKGRANTALIALMAEQLGIPKRDIDVIRGATSRLKTLRIEAEGPVLARVSAQLETYPDER
jgi:hypothetical protein